MAKSISKPSPSENQRIKESLEERARVMKAPIPHVDVVVFDFVSQAEIVYVLTLRAQFNIIRQKLYDAQQNVMGKLMDGAELEPGFYMCLPNNLALDIWEADSNKAL